MNPDIKLRLLGPFQAEREGQPLTAFKSNKVRALLAYLAVERDRAHPRDVPAGLLWPTSTSKSALALLRDALSNLRSLLGDRDAADPCIQILGDTLQFTPLDRVGLDIATFKAGISTDAGIDALEETTALYRGDFMAGFSLRNCPEFEGWLLLQREAHRRDMLQALYQLATAYLQVGDYPHAASVARRQIALEPYHEEAHRQLLRALALDGQRAQALAHYADYRETLHAELNAEPDLRTAALAQRIRDHQLTQAPSPPVEAAELSTRASRSPAPRPARMDGTTPFVGREVELTRLTAAWQRAQAGHGQVVMISGEPGSGKTRLIETFIRDSIAAQPGAIAAWGACNAQVGSGDPFLPFREILRMMRGDLSISALRAGLTPVLAQRLEAVAPEVKAVIREVGPDLIGTLVPAPRRAHAAPRAAAPLPAALCDQACRVLCRVAQRHPLILALEDLHWTDSSTLNLLAHLGRRLHAGRVLLIGSIRPAEAGPALGRTLRELQRRYGDITVDLDRGAGRAFVDAYLDSMPNVLGPAFRERLTQQTGGHALFTTALVRQLQAEGGLARDAAGAWGTTPELTWDHVPPQVEAVIAARMARLPDRLKELLTVASVEGETFTAEVVAAVLELPTDTVQRALSDALQQTYEWVAAQGLERAGSRRVARYRFRHSLFQQYLYSQLDAVMRARWHEAVGRALAELYGGDAEVAARLAYHFEAAGLTEEAVAYLEKAAAQARRLGAPAEAVALYRRGLALLSTLPPTQARTRQELDLLTGLDAPLFDAQGWGAPERADAMARAYTLAEALEEPERLLPILRALADIATAQAKHSEALIVAERALALAQETDDPTYQALGHRMAGITHFFLGHYREAHQHLEAGITLLDPAALPDINETVFLWGWLPMILLAQGYPDQATACSQKALARVQAEAHVHAQAKMLMTAGVVFHAMARQPEATRQYAEALGAMANDHHLPAFQGWATFYRGWARATLGELAAGLDEMMAGRAVLRATGTQASLAHLLTLLAEADAQSGAVERGRETLAEAFEQMAATGARSNLAEMHRVRGELHALAGERGAAEAQFEKAITVAEEQGARLWALRATVSLARLWQAQGRVDAARERLGAIYGWFTEGLETPDLATARALLDEMAEA